VLLREREREQGTHLATGSAGSLLGGRLADALCDERLDTCDVCRKSISEGARGGGEGGSGERARDAPVPAWYLFSLARPQSTTNLTPGIVTDVSAMLVARMTLRVLGGAGANALACSTGASLAYRGVTRSCARGEGASAHAEERVGGG